MSICSELYRCDRDSVQLEHNSPAKCIALAQVAGGYAFAKPFDPLLGAAVGKAFGHDITLSTFLNLVIADLCGRIQAFLNIPFFKNFPFRICRVGPHAGETISLQFDPH